jgi:hypothetical protein
VGREGLFVKFDTVEHGLRAARKILQTYLKQGYDTPDKIIRHFSETDQDVYVQHVCEWAEWKPDDIIQGCTDLTNIIWAMSRQETGNIPSDEQLEAMWDD